MNSKTKKKTTFENNFKEIIKKLKKCEGCEYELVEAFMHAKENPTDKVFLTVGYDDEDNPHIGIRVYDKKGRKIIWW